MLEVVGHKLEHEELLKRKFLLLIMSIGCYDGGRFQSGKQ